MFELSFETFILAQDEAPPLPGQVTGVAGEDGSPAGPAGSGAPPASPFGGLWQIFLVMIVLFLLFSIFGQRREKKKREEMIGSIKKHDRVQTVGGVIGSVVEVKPDLVVLKVDESSNTRITFSRSAIQQVISPAQETSGATEETS